VVGETIRIFAIDVTMLDHCTSAILQADDPFFCERDLRDAGAVANCGERACRAPYPALEVRRQHAPPVFRSSKTGSKQRPVPSQFLADCVCRSSGNESEIAGTVLATSVVWSVDKTRCRVSALHGNTHGLRIAHFPTTIMPAPDATRRARRGSQGHPLQLRLALKSGCESVRVRYSTGSSMVINVPASL